MRTPDNVGGQATSFRVTDGVTTTPVTATHTNGHDISWARFTVAGVPPPAPFCFGDGSGTACPCANSGIRAAVAPTPCPPSVRC
ncbi:MAG: hypothetical protein IPJ19_18750 [Planctomycetes bacterium]|nr:hypothetical protein [Planctomycetota bacterium]